MWRVTLLYFICSCVTFWYLNDGNVVTSKFYSCPVLTMILEKRLTELSSDVAFIWAKMWQLEIDPAGYSSFNYALKKGRKRESGVWENCNLCKAVNACKSQSFTDGPSTNSTCWIRWWATGGDSASATAQQTRVNSPTLADHQLGLLLP